MKILVLTKSDNFNPAIGIKNYLLNNGNEAFVYSGRLPSVAILNETKFDIAISCHYSKIIKPQEVECFKYGIVNIHPSMLPYGRGSDPVIWSMIANVPTGMTFHWIDEGIDTGNILFQLEIPRNELETAEDLYNRITSYYQYAFPIFWDELYLKLRKGIKPIGKKQDLLDSPLYQSRKRGELKTLGNLTGSHELRIFLALMNSQYRNIYAIDENGDRYDIVVEMKKVIE